MVMSKSTVAAAAQLYREYNVLQAESLDVLERIAMLKLTAAQRERAKALALVESGEGLEPDGTPVDPFRGLPRA